MSIQVGTVEYRDGETLLEAYVAHDEAVSGPRPGVLVAHTWAGRTEFEERKAEQLAELGYVGVALDMYGKGVRGDGPEENARLLQPFRDDRELLQRRMGLALKQLKAMKGVDPERTAAIGFCFGGMCVLDLARTSSEPRGVVSFHGLLDAPGNTSANTMSAKALILHGWKDPLATPEQVLEFSREMDELDADWQLVAYGKAMHAFTNPNAADAPNGMQYDASVEHRSWAAMRLFLDEVFA